MAEPEFVRVRVKDNGAHITVSRVEYDVFSDGYELLKQDAVDARGVPLPDKPKTDVATATATKRAAPKKTAAKRAAADATTTTDPDGAPAGGNTSQEG